MNRNTRNLLIGVAGALFATGALMAQAPAPAPTPTQKREARETQRDINQQQRILQGEKSGQLTPKEASHLERQEGRIDKAEANAAKDGKVSKQEARNINRMQNRESKRIYRDKHNAKTTK
ncbi:MAG TPA: hypothetical protein VFF76_00835 [Holophagaceae bacterium]|jgi:hypothetical protein|nr:hypothetical protein [Holophagaceae bacterium]